ncbi:MAG TPA: endopeptidase La [Gemmatimonadota bacterium]|nr:endopeptidase La [Gemmatimonadota bacterium]
MADDPRTPQDAAEAESERDGAVDDIDVTDAAGPTLDLASVPDTVPLVSVPDLVLYPYTIVPLAFDEEPLIAAVDESMRGARMIGVLAQVPGDQEVRVGTVAVIHRLVKHPTAGMRLLVQGVVRFRVDEILREEPYREARIQVLPEPEGPHGERVEALLREGYDLAQSVIAASSALPDELQQAVRQLIDPSKFAYMIASMVRMDMADKQEVLETDDLERKLEKVLEALRRELQVLEIGKDIKGQVDEELQKKQREYYLREQLSAIREELGEVGDEEKEVERIRACLEEAEVPDHVMEAAEEQFQRLKNVPAASPEYSVVMSYLDWLCQVPWAKSTEDHLDLTHAREILDEDHYDLKEVKDRILEYLAVRQLKQDTKGPILALVGPPGVGKTSIGKSIARAMGREFVRMSLGGMRDEAEIRGHRRTYIGAMPGRVVQSLKRVGVNNPVFMLDEIDKVGADFRGDPSSALLEVLDPEQNDSFRDHYLDLPVDLSNVFFIATGNVVDTIQPALLDRMEVIRLPGYTDREKIHIARQYLLPKQREDHGLGNDGLEVTDAALERIVSEYTREAGVRNLERELAKIARKVAAKVARGEVERAVVDAEDVREYLGPQRAFHEVARRTARPGVATALAWTAAGGEILFVEATTMPGSKGFTLTGKLGDVMQESARAALAYVRSHAKELGLDERFFDQVDIHLHVPAGAVSKDGPSAGVTMATALASALTGRKVRADVAMTGEITLTGQVLPVGGIKEKLVAAKRSGVRTVILPERNRPHVEEVESDLVEGLDFVYVESIGQVLEAALADDEETAPEAEVEAEAVGRA